MKQWLVLLLLMVSLAPFAQTTIHGPSPYYYLTSMIAYDPATGIIYGWNGTAYVALVSGTVTESDPLSIHTSGGTMTGLFGLAFSGDPPTPTRAGQLYFHESSNLIYCSYLDGLGSLAWDQVAFQSWVTGQSFLTAPTPDSPGWWHSSGAGVYAWTIPTASDVGAAAASHAHSAADISSGNLSALRLPATAADLGAADVEINIGNTNGTFKTNLTTDGTITATSGFVGSLTGTASGNLTSEADGVIGNEVGGATNGTLSRSGAGTTLDPFTLALNLANANTWTVAQVIDGTADAIQLIVQGHSTQTANVFEVQNSAGAYLFKVNPTGVASIASTLNVVGNINGSGNMAYNGEAVNNAMTPSAWTGFGQKFNFAAAPGASNVAVLDTAANSRARKGVTTDAAAAVLGVVDGAGSAATAVIIFGGITKVNCDAANVARGDTLVVSTATDGCAMTNNSETNPKLIVGYALEEKTTGSAGLVAVWVK